MNHFIEQGQPGGDLPCAQLPLVLRQQEAASLNSVEERTVHLGKGLLGCSFDFGIVVSQSLDNFFSNIIEVILLVSRFGQSLAVIVDFKSLEE